MSASVSLVLGALVLLEVKHFVVDYVLQTPYQYQNKGKYGHPGGIVHAGMHGVVSLLVFLLLPVSFWVGFWVIVGELIFHYHVDWSKEQINHRFDLKQNTGPYWATFGIDQLLHHLTYVVMVWILAAYSLPAGA